MRNLQRLFLVCCAAGCLQCQNVKQQPETSEQPESSLPLSAHDESAQRIAMLQHELGQAMKVLESQQRNLHEEPTDDPPPGSLAFLHLYEESTGWMRELDMQHFDTMVGKGRSIVYIGATWCSPCIPQSKILKEVSVEVGTQVNIVKITSAKNPDEQHLLARLNINSLELHLPTLIFLSDGQPVVKVEGLTSKENVLSNLR